MRTATEGRLEHIGMQATWNKLDIERGASCEDGKVKEIRRVTSKLNSDQLSDLETQNHPKSTCHLHDLGYLGSCRSLGSLQISISVAQAE